MKNFLFIIAALSTLMIKCSEAGAAITAGGLGPVCAACIIGVCEAATTPCLGGCLASWVGYPVCATACIALFCVPCVVTCACHDVDSTNVILSNGTEIKMSFLKVGDSVMTYNKSTNETTPTKVLHINVVTAEFESIEITSSDGNSVKITPSHQVYIKRYGDVSTYYTHAGELSIRD